MKKTLSFLLLCIIAIQAIGQNDPGILNLERIFSSSEFNQEGFGPARWVEEGKGYTTLENSSEYRGAREVIRYETETGERSILIPAERLIPQGQSTPLSIANYIWSPDKKKMLIFTNTTRVW